MFQIRYASVPDGVAVTITGTISDPGLAPTVADGLACLAEDGDAVAALSALILETSAGGDRHPLIAGGETVAARSAHP